jgi:RND family efflux transporter MFP subunit
MKATRVVWITCVLLIIFGSCYIYANASGNNKNPAENEAQIESSATPDVSEKSVPVSVSAVSKDSVSWMDLIGTVKANDQVKIFATASGQLQEILVSEGDKVKYGDPLFYIGGINGNKPAALIQLESAQTAYNNALNSVKLTLKGNEVSIKSAELQLDSAKHLAQGNARDLRIMDENLTALDTALYFLNDTFTASNSKNNIDVEKLEDGITELKNGILTLEREKSDAIDELDSNPSDSEEINAQIDEINSQLDELYTQLEDAQDGLTQLQSGLNAANNQILGQIAQTKNQGEVLYLTKLGTESKLGMTEDGTTDQVKLAEEGLNAAKIKNEASVLQTKAQLDAATSALELAKLQADILLVRSPINGTVGQISVNEGDIVSGQSVLTQIHGQQKYDLIVGVNVDSANSISLNDKAEILIGGKYIKVPVKSISPSTDTSTKLVNVTVGLPNISLRSGQTLRVRIPLNIAGADTASGVRFVPLDAVIIATEEQYVFVAQDGKAVKKIVTTGDVFGDQIQILSGLDLDDRVIVEEAKNLMDGQDISLQ